MSDTRGNIKTPAAPLTDAAAKPADAEVKAGPTVSTEEAPVEEAEPTDPVDKAIAAWMRKVGRNSPLSRNTEALNHVVKNLPLLKSLLKGDQN